MKQNKFDFAQLRRYRIADECVCCGSRKLQAAPAILMPFVAHRAFGWAPVLIDDSWGLHTIQNGMAYTVCRSLQCGSCGLLFSDIRFSTDELERLYSNYRGIDYTVLRETYEPGYAQRNEAFGHQIEYGDILENFLGPLLPSVPLSILDWGGDSGKNTPFRHRAKVHDIYDISNCPVIPGAYAVSRAEAMSKHYDLVVCSNVLEHVPYPSDLLLDIKHVMRPESLLYIEVPFEDVIRQRGYEAVTHKKHWHEHVNFFSPDSLRTLLSNSGLKTVAFNFDASIKIGLKFSYLMQIACQVVG
jgi:SAM-dependent methyltransferase